MEPAAPARLAGGRGRPSREAQLSARGVSVKGLLIALAVLVVLYMADQQFAQGKYTYACDVAEATHFCDLGATSNLVAVMS